MSISDFPRSQNRRHLPNLFGILLLKKYALRQISDMSSRLRAARVTLANLKPAPRSQQSVRVFFALLHRVVRLMAFHRSKNELEGVKVRDTEGRQAVVQMGRNLAPDQGSSLDLREDRRQ